VQASSLFKYIDQRGEVAGDVTMSICYARQSPHLVEKRGCTAWVELVVSLLCAIV
jgi:hypothetical protein